MERVVFGVKLDTQTIIRIFKSFFEERALTIAAHELVEKPRVFDPEGKAALTPENLLFLTPVKS